MFCESLLARFGQMLESFFTDKEILLLMSAISATHIRNSSRFRHGPHAGKPLSQLINDLRAKRVDPSAGRPMLENVFNNGVFRAITNRRTSFTRTSFPISTSPTRRQVTARRLESEREDPFIPNQISIGVHSE